MFVMAVMDMLCVGSIAFCLRFLVALFQERRHPRIDERAHPQLSSGKSLKAVPRQQREPMSRAA
jgi:hypothetical protein